MRKVVTGIFVLGLLVPLPAWAHSDEGEMTVTVAEQGSGESIILEVGIIYSDDGHLAEEASVSATLTGPGGEGVGPLDLPRIAGARYGTEAPVSGPGVWTMLITSENPTAEAEASLTVTEPVTTTTTSTATTSAPTTSPATTATTQPDVTTTIPDEEAPSGSVPVIPILAAVVIVGGAWAVVRRSRH